MIPEKAFAGLLQLNESWEVVATEFETTPTERFLIGVRETAKLWPTLSCGMEQCGGKEVVCHDPRRGGDGVIWTPMGDPRKSCVLPRGLAAKPVARCGPVRVPWEGKGNHFTKDFEAFALTLKACFRKVRDPFSAPGWPGCRGGGRKFDGVAVPRGTPPSRTPASPTVRRDLRRR